MSDQDTTTRGTGPVDFAVAGVQLQVPGELSSTPQAVEDSDGNQSVLQLSTANTITSQLGIGTVPSFPLHVASGSTVRLEMGANTYLSLGAPGTLSVDQVSIPGGRFIVTDGGNVGISQPSPQYTLDVSGSLNVTGCATFANLPGESTAPSGANLQIVYIDTNTGILYVND